MVRLIICLVVCADCCYRLKQIMAAVAPAFTLGIRILNKTAPFIYAAGKGIYRFYSGLSSNMSTALYGLALRWVEQRT